MAAPTSAHANVAIAIVTGVDFTNYSFSSPPAGLSQTVRPGLAFGGLVNIDLGDPLELETGLLFDLKRPEETLPGTGAEPSSLRAFDIPVLLRYNPLSWFSVGAGPYYCQGFDEINSSITTGFTTSEPSYSGSNTSKLDYGVSGSVQFRQTLSYDLRALLDVRYFYGLNNVDTTGAGPKYFRDLQVMIGLAVGRFK